MDEQYFDYSRPGETGNKADVRWVALRNGQGVGLLACGIPLLSVNALRYTTDELNRVLHGFELTRSDFITFNLDWRQMGLGGDTSWGARPHPPYQIEPDQPYAYRFRLRALTSWRELPMILSKEVLP